MKAAPWTQATPTSSSSAVQKSSSVSMRLPPAVVFPTQPRMEGNT